MDTLKPLEEITIADERWTHFVHFNPIDQTFKPIGLAERYAAIEAITLLDSVPDMVREHFDTAKNLLLYAWFVYRFIPVAELHAYSTVEMALKEQAERESLNIKNLKKLLEVAIQRGWIVDDGFANVRSEHKAMEEEEAWRLQFGLPSTPEEEDAQRYCKVLLDTMPYLRNDLAHGSRTLHPGGVGTLAICADLINQLFRAS